MSRQMVMDRRGRTLGYIDTACDGEQKAICQRGTLLGIFDPRTGETLAPGGAMIGDRNLLTQLLQKRQ